ncbi:MAG: hypothetical protein V3V14_00235 [Saprospiraceae bacterium]
MKKRNIYWIIAGLIDLLTTFVHLIAGQIDLVNPLLNSELQLQTKTEWLGVWHAISVFLLFHTIILLRYGFNKTKIPPIDLLTYLGWFYLLIAIPFMIVSGIQSTLAPQFIIFLPIGIFILLGIKKHKQYA